MVGGERRRWNKKDYFAPPTATTATTTEMFDEGEEKNNISYSIPKAQIFPIEIK